MLKKGDRIAIVGDSITEQKIYSKFIELYLLACVPELDLTTYQFGWSGEKAPGFATRMENDFVPWKATFVLTCFGMNDGNYRPYTDQIGEAYEAGTRKIQNRCKELGARMVIGGPGPVDTETWKRNEPDADLYYNENLSKLSEIAGRVAKSNGFAYAGLHPLMMDVMKKAKAALGNDYQVCGGDGVHPGPNGHLIMAYGFLKAMGFNGDIGTIIVDMNAGATATEGHKINSASNGKVEIASSRYPFCFYGNEKDPNGNRSILPFLPFNRDLNRYMLIVNNLSTPMAEVVWGKFSKTFSKAELEAGINLAEKFPESPLSEPFRSLEQVVSDKQNRETWTIKGVITNFRNLKYSFPEDKEVDSACNLLRGKLLERNAKDAILAQEAVKVVNHTIQINPEK